MGYASLEEIRPGQLIAERYRLEAPIGHGAMGSVWRAVHVRLEAPVAIKLLKSAIADDPEMLERFLREARSAAAVRSSHVVQIFDYGVDRDLPYIAMELLVGEPLDARLDARGVLEPPELDKVFTEVARAVGNAHAQGVVHRDIKPANIFIAREGDLEVTKVLDFGIAKLVDQRLAAPVGSGTHTGNILGTPSYMSPEQARGQRQVDHRSDLWSLAVLAFECLTGRQPFESTTLGDLVVKICTADPLVPSAVATVPAAFDAWFSRGVSKDPGARFRSALEMADELHALLSAEGLGADSWRRSSTDRRFPPERLEQATQRGPAPREEPAPVVARAAPGDAEPLPARAEPSALMSTGPIATEVLQPVSHAARRRRHRGLAALGLGVVGIALALGLGRAPFDGGPPPDAQHDALFSGARAPQPARSSGARAPQPARSSGARAPQPARSSGARAPQPARSSGAQAPQPARVEGSPSAPTGAAPAPKPAPALATSGEPRPAEPSAPAATSADSRRLAAPAPASPRAATPGGKRRPPAAGAPPSVPPTARAPAPAASVAGGTPPAPPPKAAPARKAASARKASSASAERRPTKTEAPPSSAPAAAPEAPFDPYAHRL